MLNDLDEDRPKIRRGNFALMLQAVACLLVLVAPATAMLPSARANELLP
jgi:hypothetical protein